MLYMPLEEVLQNKVVVLVQNTCTCIVKHITMSVVQFILCLFFPLYTFTGPKIIDSLLR